MQVLSVIVNCIRAEELTDLAERLDKVSTAYGMEISAEKTKLMTNNTSGINTEIKVNAWDCHKLQISGHIYNWLGFQAWDTLQESIDNSSIDKAETSLDWQEYLSLLQDTTDAPLVTSNFLYVCESWTLTAELKRRIQAMKMRCYRKILHSYTKTMLPTRKYVPRSSRQLDHTKTIWRS